MQISVNGVDMLLNKYEDFVMTADGHDEKIKALCEQASWLIKFWHQDSAG